jgi:hypothetical protein
VETAFSSTALLVAIAAILWIVYLVPVWVKRTEYLATERNATRLGQTLRVLAETAETSPELRAELTARDVWRKSREAERSVNEFGLSDVQRKAKRRRQARIIITLFTTISLAALIGAWAAGSASWVIAATGAKVATGLLALVVIAQRAHQKPGVQAGSTTSSATRRTTAAAPSARAWTPPQIPAPLSARQTLPTAADALPSREELLRKARQAASQARPEEVSAERQQLAPVSQFEQMGRIAEALPSPRPNLDEVLQRRRAV